MSDLPAQASQTARHDNSRAADSVPQIVEEIEGLTAIYANFLRVSGTPEELILDFGLNSQSPGSTTAPVKVTQRIVLNHFTAKRLWLTLGSALQRHEQVFGLVEIDINKRVIPSIKPIGPR